VGVQPFGGEALSGTGPKAGGPHYLLQLSQSAEHAASTVLHGETLDPTPAPSAHLNDQVCKTYVAHEAWCNAFNSQQRRVLVREAFEKVSALGAGFWKELDVETRTDLPGPTGEKNTLRLFPRGVIYCAGCDETDPHCVERQIAKSLVSGSGVLVVKSDVHQLDIDAIKVKLCRNGAPEDLITFVSDADAPSVIEADINAVVAEGRKSQEMSARRNLRAGAQIPVLSQNDPVERFFLERVLTVNTTAAGGNATLLSEI
jgi:RHH-type proline utilization regulon transcriptional repressor/proline dehydrogenase/delta 1-pyrroline-5-carboxylate dehydrogenase